MTGDAMAEQGLLPDSRDKKKEAPKVTRKKVDPERSLFKEVEESVRFAWP
jgi:hypothetical protein